MARSNEDKAAQAPPEPPAGETGFAALEAKVEEVQVEAAIEAELAAEDAAIVAALAPAESPQAAPRAEPRPASAGAPSLAEPFVAAAQLQAETLARLIRARGVQDLFDVQVRYGRGLADLYWTNATRWLRLFGGPTAFRGGL